MRKFFFPILLIVGIPGLVSDFNTWLEWFDVSWPPGLGTALVVIAVAWAVFYFARERTGSTGALTPDQLFELEKLDRERRDVVIKHLHDDWPSYVFAGVVILIVCAIIVGVFLAG